MNLGINLLKFGNMAEPIRFHTVFNKTTNECVGDDFTINGALVAVVQLNLEDDSEDWVYHVNENAEVVDSMASLVQDHHSLLVV